MSVVISIEYIHCLAGTINSLPREYSCVSFRGSSILIDHSLIIDRGELVSITFPTCIDRLFIY